MPRLILITFLSFVAILSTVAPYAVFAQQTEREGETTYDQSYVPCGYKDTLTEEIKGGKVISSKAGPDNVIDFANQCKVKHVIIIAKRIIMGWIIFGVTAATMGFAYAGYLYITAMGSEEKITHAHSIFTKTIWGFVFMLSAFLIVYALEDIFLTDEAQKRSLLEQRADQKQP